MATLLDGYCPAPFISPNDVAGDGGYVLGRFCGNITEGNSCCLPCPSEKWIYSRDFDRNLNIAYWFNVPALVLQVWLLLTFLVLPADVSHRHYLSVGLVLSLVMCELAFIVPLGAKPDMCWDDITPRDMYSSMSCAWSGALIVTGAMGAIVWVLLRSLWTHLRVCWDVHETPAIFYLFQTLGWGIPGLFLALTMPLTGVSYRIGSTCLPNQKNALVTWIGWLIAFACAAALIQFITTSFCLWLYVRQMIRGESSQGSRESNLTYRTPIQSPTSINPAPLAKLDRRMAWRRVRRVMKLQWRSIALTILGIIETVYFAAVFVNENNKIVAGLKPGQQEQIVQWLICYLRNGEDKSKCEKIADIVGLNEGVIEAAFFIIAIVGLLTFALMARRSMFVGWYNLLRHPITSLKDRRNSMSDEDFVIISPIEPTKRKSFGRQLESEKPDTHHHQPNVPTLSMPMTPGKYVNLLTPPISPVSTSMPSGVLPDTVNGERNPSIPEAGDVTQRHETTNWFDDKAQGDGLEGAAATPKGKADRRSKRFSRVNEDDLA